MAYNKRFAVETLMDIAVDLQRYDSAEFKRHAVWLMTIAAEVRKEFPPVPTVAELESLLPPPKLSDPNCKIPRPKSPNGKGPSDALVPEVQMNGVAS